MGWYKDKRGAWRYCNNPNHNHYYENIGSNSGWGMAFIILGILSIPSIIGPFILIPLGISQLSKKDDPDVPKYPGTPSGWCK